ncbi:hypothetical protein V7S43_014200 [Phytophthora oleae]|uniref:Uncharacterized protein n=1 Tax=Phytophthora oleae TaxID=2107226 RepID=A0ABD3F1Z6_9STRA
MSVTLRSLETQSFSFEFDGTNSDIVRQLYVRHKAEDSADQVALSAVPAAVTSRLDQLVAFNDLPGLVHALGLWLRPLP